MAEAPRSDASAAPALLEVRGVWKSFGETAVLRGVDLALREGELLALLGPSGCGKSVLLKLVVGLLEPDAGEVLLRGRALSSLSPEELQHARRSVGMLFQQGALFDSMSVHDNVAYGLREHLRHELTEEQVTERVRWALRAVGLAAAEQLMPGELSGGMSRRVSLARTIALRPELVLYDEPTMGLDPINTARIGRLITRLRSSLGSSALVVTHDLKLAFSIADRVALLDEGRIVAQGTPEELRASAVPVVREFLASRPDLFPPPAAG